MLNSEPLTTYFMGVVVQSSNPIQERDVTDLRDQHNPRTTQMQPRLLCEAEHLIELSVF